MKTTADVATASGRIGREVREARSRVGLTRAQLAGLAGCSLSTLGAIEAGAVPRRSPTLERVRAVLAQVDRERTSQ
jgi:transcriptional regulator with XRE-family HTH domain